MTSNSTDTHNKSVAAFKSLAVDEQLAALALIYSEVADFLTLLKSMDFEQLISFLSSVV